MPTIITRLYETEAQASEIVSKLRSIDYMERKISMVSMPAPMEGQSDGSASISAKLRELGVYQTAARKYANKMIPGNAMVVVGAPFGSAGPVGPIMDTVPTIDAGVKYEANLLKDVSNPINIIRVSGSRSIIKKRSKPRTTPSRKPKPFLGLKTISQPKAKKSLLSNRPITGGLIKSR